MRSTLFLFISLSIIVTSAHAADDAAAPRTSPGFRVGAAAVDLTADDSMVIAGGILPWKAKGQEGKLRAVATVLKLNDTKLAIVALDILMIERKWLDPAAAQIEKQFGIPASNVLINCTHTHHAPSTMKVHGYDSDEAFCKIVQNAIVEAVGKANDSIAADDCGFFFGLGKETTVGQNSRLMLSDGTIYWIGRFDDAVRPTSPFDPELPILAFRDGSNKLLSVIFNHSTHTIGSRLPNVRSPSFYGLSAQELEQELGGTFTFLEGASGSTHNLTLRAAEAVERMKAALRDTLFSAKPRPVTRLAALKRPFKFKVRQFDEAAEEKAVSFYYRKRAGGIAAEPGIQVFRDMRKNLAPLQGEERTTWIQTILIGDVALVGVPGEYFTKLGLDIKNRSPFRQTYIAELANDWIGYIPDRDGFKLGGYQVWTGYHSYVEPGTGERIVDQAVEMLKDLDSAGK